MRISDWSSDVCSSDRLKKAGLGFAYHNHDFEFTMKPGGTSLFDTLIADADPALVQIELDLFWAVAAGEDPKAIIRRLAGRIYRSEEHTSELQSVMRISNAVFCLKKKNINETMDREH